MGAIFVARLLVILLLGIALLTTGGCLGGRNFTAAGDPSQTAGEPSVGAAVGSIAPEFALLALDGSTVRLSDLRGKAVVLNFWATWCPPCRNEMPVLQKAYEKYRDEGVAFLGIDVKESEAEVLQFVRKGGYGWTFLLDTSGRVSSSYRVSGIPTTVFIDLEGIIRDIHVGELTASSLDSKLGKIR